MSQQTPMLHAQNFEDIIDRRGRLVQWQEAIICSCWNLDSGQPEYTCMACNGAGYVYQPAIEAKALVTSIASNKEYTDMAGVFEVGDGVMTIPKRIKDSTGAWTDNPMFDIGDNDRVILTDDEYKTSEILIKKCAIGNRAPDTLLNLIVTRIKGISTFDTVTGIETKYELEKDYRVNGNVIEWLEDGNGPMDGTQYTVTYAHRPIYKVIATLPKPRHQDGQDLPRYVALRYLSGAVDS